RKPVVIDRRSNTAELAQGTSDRGLYAGGLRLGVPHGHAGLLHGAARLLPRFRQSIPAPRSMAHRRMDYRHAPHRFRGAPAAEAVVRVPLGAALADLLRHYGVGCLLGL